MNPVSHSTDTGASERGAKKASINGVFLSETFFYVIQKLNKARTRIENYSYHTIHDHYIRQTQGSQLKIDTIINLFDLLEEKIKDLRKFSFFSFDGCAEICSIDDLIKSLEAVSDLLEKVLATGLAQGVAKAGKTYIDIEKKRFLLSNALSRV